MNALMLSCVKATELIEIKNFRPLNIKERVQLKMHTSLCSGCRHYAKQSLLISKLLQQNFSAIKNDINTNELERTILSKLS